MRLILDKADFTKAMHFVKETITDEYAKGIKENIRNKAYDTGKLQKSVEYKLNSAGAEIISDIGYAGWVQKKTKVFNIDSKIIGKIQNKLDKAKGNK